MKNLKMSTISFGSCFSARITQMLYEKLNINSISNVRTVRTDFFMDSVINKKTPFIKKQTLELITNSLKEKDFDSNLRNIKNQIVDIEDGIGFAYKFDLESKMNFFKALKYKSDKKLILLDNFTDIVMRYNKFEDESRLFFVDNWLKSNEENSLKYTLEEYGSIIELKEYYREFIVFLKNESPDAQIVFCNFPFNLSVSDTIKQRAKEFNENFIENNFLKSLDIIVIDSLLPYKEYESPNWSHFIFSYYMQLANYILGVAIHYKVPEKEKVTFIGGKRAENIANYLVNKYGFKMNLLIRETRLETIVERDIWEDENIQIGKNDDFLDYLKKEEKRINKNSFSNIVLIDLSVELNNSYKKLNNGITINGSSGKKIGVKKLISYINIIVEFVFDKNKNALIALVIPDLSTNQVFNLKVMLDKKYKLHKNVIVTTPIKNINENINFLSESILGYYNFITQLRD